MSHSSFLSSVITLVICMTVWPVCITVTGSTVVGAAVIQEQLSNLQGEVVVGRMEKALEAALGLLILFGEELQRCCVEVLSVPQHGVAGHA